MTDETPEDDVQPIEEPVETPTETISEPTE